jgi:hypothetical protein
LFSKCSAKNLWPSSLNWALNRQYGLVAKPSGKSASNSINTSAFIGILDGEIRKFRIANKSETAQRFATSCGSQFDE